MQDVPARFRHVLTHAIGIRDTGSDPDIRRYRLTAGDRLLLGTDGSESTWSSRPRLCSSLVRRGILPADPCQALGKPDLDGGGKDNVTVVVGRYEIPVGT